MCNGMFGRSISLSHQLFIFKYNVGERELLRGLQQQVLSHAAREIVLQERM